MPNQTATLCLDSNHSARTASADAGGEEPISVSQRAEQLASEWFELPAHDDVETFLAQLPITIGGPPIDDPYAHWHPNTTDFGAISRAHLIRLYHGWEHETALHRYLSDEPQLVATIGLNSLPNQSTLYTAWNDRFSAVFREDLRHTVETVIEIARANGVQVPVYSDPSEESQAEELSASAQRRLARQTAKEVWQVAKPLVGTVVDFDRPDDPEIHDNAFLELHTYLGCHQDLYAETGAADFVMETTRERTPTGSYHRNCIRALPIEQHRQNHRAAMTEVIARARQQGKLTGKQTTAIDITEGKPFWGNRDTAALQTQILGTKESNQEVAYQYATIQVVGDDLPIVLDAVPVVKGMSRREIVKELLEHATEMVTIDLVLMDREFEHDAIKEVCETYGVHYLNLSRMFSDEKLTAKRLAREDIAMHVESDAAAGQPPRKRLWIPRVNVNSDELLPDGGIPELDTQAEADEESASAAARRKREIRRELGEEFLEILDDPGVETIKWALRNPSIADNPAEETVDWALGTQFLETAAESAYKESYAVSADGIRHVVFETNHPDLVVADGDTNDTAVIHRIARFTRQYANRWGIENGFKKVKSFMAETTSTDHSYRFFNFSFACVLYSLWRLVDLLVKRSLGDERAEPRIRASTFLAIAKQADGLDPPD